MERFSLFDLSAFLQKPQIIISGKNYRVEITKELEDELVSGNAKIISQFQVNVNVLENNEVATAVTFFRFEIYDGEVFYEHCLGKNAR